MHARSFERKRNKKTDGTTATTQYKREPTEPSAAVSAFDSENARLRLHFVDAGRWSLDAYGGKTKTKNDNVNEAIDHDAFYRFFQRSLVRPIKFNLSDACGGCLASPSPIACSAALATAHARPAPGTRALRAETRVSLCTRHIGHAGCGMHDMTHRNHTRYTGPPSSVCTVWGMRTYLYTTMLVCSAGEGPRSSRGRSSTSSKRDLATMLATIS